MAIAPYALKVVWSGALVEGEVFAHSQWFDGTTIGGDLTKYADWDTNLFNAATVSTLLSTAVLALFPTTTSWNKIRSYCYGASGQLLQAEEVAISKVGTGTFAMPNQVSWVVSQRTGLAGRAQRGRAYLPGPATSKLSGSTGQMNTTDCGTLANAYAAWLHGVEIGSPSVTPSVVMSGSRTAMYPLDSVIVDTRLDTQRSRASRATIVGRALATVT